MADQWPELPRRKSKADIFSGTMDAVTKLADDRITELEEERDAPGEQYYDAEVERKQRDLWAKAWKRAAKACAVEIEREHRHHGQTRTELTRLAEMYEKDTAMWRDKYWFIAAAAKRIDGHHLDVGPDSPKGQLRTALGTGTRLVKTFNGGRYPQTYLRLTELFEDAAVKERENPEYYYPDADPQEAQDEG